MELRTHTRLWQVEKKLYKIYDFTLPMPLSVRMLGIFLATASVWFTFCHLIGITFGPPFGHLIWITPPVAATYMANKPVAEGKRFGELIVSQVSFFVGQHRQYASLAPYTAPERVRVTGEVWQPETVSAETAADAVTA